MRPGAIVLTIASIGLLAAVLVYFARVLKEVDGVALEKIEVDHQAQVPETELNAPDVVEERKPAEIKPEEAEWQLPPGAPRPAKEDPNRLDVQETKQPADKWDEVLRTLERQPEEQRTPATKKIFRIPTLGGISVSVECGKEGVQPLLGLLEDRDLSSAGEEAAEAALRQIAREFDEAIPDVIAAATLDKSYDVRRAAIRAMAGRHGIDSSLALIEIMDLPSEEDFPGSASRYIVRASLAFECREALQAMGPQVVRDLIKVLEEGSPSQKSEAWVALTNTLAHHEDASEKQLEFLCDALFALKRSLQVEHFEKRFIWRLSVDENEALVEVERRGIEERLVIGDPPKYRGPGLLTWTDAAKLVARASTTADRVEAAQSLASNGLPHKGTLAAVVRDPRFEVRELGIAIILSIGPKAYPALVPLVVKDRSDVIVRLPSCSIPVEIGSPTVPRLAQAFADPDKRFLALLAFINLGAEVAPDLVKLLRSEDAEVRTDAAFAFEKIPVRADQDQTVIRGLSDALNDEKPLIRARSANGLGKIGPAAREAIPALLDALEDNDPEARLRAALALVAIDKSRAGPAVPILLERARQKPSLLSPGIGRIESAQALVRLGRREDGLAVLFEILQDSHRSDLRPAAAIALGELHEDARQAIPLLVSSLERDRPLRRAAARALAMIGLASEKGPDQKEARSVASPEGTQAIESAVPSGITVDLEERKPQGKKPEEAEWDEIDKTLQELKELIRKDQERQQEN